MARKMSVIRMIIVSMNPPKKPATAPSSSPIVSAMAVAPMPIFSDTRAP